jgi:hypothetical protein
LKLFYIRRMNSNSKILFVLFILGISVSQIQAQNTTSEVQDTVKKEFYVIKKSDGAEYVGEVISDDGREVLVLTKSIGKIFIIKSDIVSMTRIDASKLSQSSDGLYEDFRVEGPYTTRYFFTTNALPIKKKENYMMIGLQGPEVHFAVNDNLSLGVMATWIASPIALAAKYSFDAKSESKTHFALGTIMASSGYLLQAQGFGGIHWATVTHGDRKSNVSFSAGYAYAKLYKDNSNSIGRKYYAQYPVIDGNYYYGLESSVDNELRNKGVDYYQQIYSPNKARGSAVMGISGITSIGQKSSFIFDALAFLGTQYGLEYVDSRVYPNITYQTGTGTYATDDITVAEYKTAKIGIKPTVIIMPAIRFNRSYNKAFQVALAGVIAKDNYGDIFSFPVPTVSWLRQF